MFHISFSEREQLKEGYFNHFTSSTARNPELVRRGLSSRIDAGEDQRCTFNKHGAYVILRIENTKNEFSR